MTFPLFPGLLAALAGLLATPLLAAESACIDIDAAAPGTPVSPMLYGAFFEEINRAGDGGLYAEMLQNRSFEDAPQPVAWTLLKPANADASWAIDANRPLHPDNPHSLRLDIRSTGGGRVGVANGGFKGTPLNGKEATDETLADWLPKFAEAVAKSRDCLCVRAGAEYRLTFSARAAPGWSGPLTATLERPDGTALATAETTGPGTEWSRFAVTLKPSADETDARLVLGARSAGTLWLDMVSLFPQATFKGRENGLRPDLAGMLAGLRPAFLRFPGGSFVEGLMLADAYRWKRTIGDPAARPGFQGIWGYRSNDGLGFHEYLQLCEDLGAAPLYVANCGMSEKEFATPEQMRAWVQDAVDALEYANGPATSRWGGRCARRRGIPRRSVYALSRSATKTGWIISGAAAIKRSTGSGICPSIRRSSRAIPRSSRSPRSLPDRLTLNRFANRFAHQCARAFVCVSSRGGRGSKCGRVPCRARTLLFRQSPADMIFPPAIPAPASRQKPWRAAFTLVEMLVVMGIILLLLALLVPAFTAINGGRNFSSATNDIGSTMEQARAYAMANNTYVYVGIGEYDVTEASSVSPRSTGAGKFGQIVLAVVASRDGTRGYDVNNPSGTLNPTSLTAIDKLHAYDDVHLSDFGASPPASGRMARPAVTDGQYRLGSATSTSVTPFNWPLGGSQYNFTKVIQIDPQGVARIQSASNADGITSYMEIDLQPTHANIIPALPTDQNLGNQAALQIDCMTGATRVYHP